MGDSFRDLEAESRAKERTQKALPVSVILPIKPLSVNEAWQGRRYKTKAYKKYEKILLGVMPDIPIPPPPYTVSYLWLFILCR